MTLSERLHRAHADIDVDCAYCQRDAIALGMGHLLPAQREPRTWVERMQRDGLPAKDLTDARP